METISIIEYNCFIIRRFIMFILIIINIAISCLAVYHMMEVREELKLFEDQCTINRYGVNIESPMNDKIDKIV